MIPKSHWERFGSWIRKARRGADLTQVEVAKRAGIHEVQYARIEKGESGTKRETVIAIADAIGLDTAATLNRAGYASVLDDGDADAPSALVTPPYPKRPANLVEFIEALEALGLEIAWDALSIEDADEERFEDLKERIKFDVEFEMRKK